MTAVVVVGFMGAGKTTVGRLVADRLGREFIDSDEHLERTLGRSVREIFATDGEAAFRQLEHRAVSELMGRDDLVLAVGGGAVEDPRTRFALQRATVVHLHVTFADALVRVGGDPGRPMLQRPDLAAVFDRRTTTFAAAADIVVDTGGRTTAAVAAEVIARLTATDSSEGAQLLE